MPLFDREWTQSGQRLRHPPAFRVQCPDKPPRPLPPESGDYVEIIAEGLRRGLNGSVVVIAEPSPKDAPPWRSIPFRQQIEVVVDRPGATNSTPATEIAAANYTLENGSPQALTIVRPTGTTAQATVLSYTVPQSQVLIVRGVEIEGHDLAANRDALRWTVVIGGESIVTEDPVGIPIPLETTGAAPFLGIARQNQIVVVLVRNFDSTSPSLVVVRLFGWLIPVIQGDDSVLGSVLRPERGRAGRRFQEGTAPC